MEIDRYTGRKWAKTTTGGHPHQVPGVLLLAGKRSQELPDQGLCPVGTEKRLTKVRVLVNRQSSLVTIDGSGKGFSGPKRQTEVYRYLSNKVGPKTAKTVTKIIQIWTENESI